MSAPSPARAAAQPVQPSARRLSILQSLRAHWLISVAVLIAGVAAAVPLAYWKGRPFYYAEAVIYISPTFLKNLQEDKEVQFQSNSQYREFVSQNARTMNRYDVVFDALQKLGDRRFVWQRQGESERRAAERLQGALDIKPVPDTYQVTIGLEGVKPDGLADLVNTVADIYIQKQRGEDFYASDRRVASLRQERARAESEVDAKQEQRAQISQSLAVSSFTESFQNPYDRLIQGSKEALAAARQKRYQAESQLNAVDPAAGPDARATLAALAKDMTVHDAALTSLYSNLNQRRGLLLSQGSGLAAAHPGRKAIEREIAEIDKQLADKQTELTSAYTRDLLDQRRGEVAQARQVEASLSKDVQQLSASAADFSVQYQRGLALGSDIETIRKRLDAIDERIQFLTLEVDAPGFARIFSYARPAEVPIRSSRRKFFLIFLGASLLVALLIPAGVDALDPRVRSPEEAERILGFPPAAWIAEESQVSQAFRRDQLMRAAIAIQRNAASMGAKVVALTSAKPGGGTTTLCLGIAGELERMGVRTLLVETNAFSPDARHKGSPSLTDLLLGSSADSAGPTVPVGDTRGERHLASLKELRPLLDRIGAHYDLILLDAPPLLVAADAEFLARTADIAMLVIEASGITQGDLRRAVHTLERIQPPAVGAIANRVRVSEAGGYNQAALDEFQSGRRRGASGLLARWLWK
jgi:Mrp family chromosome partitioning ATPase